MQEYFPFVPSGSSPSTSSAAPAASSSSSSSRGSESPAHAKEVSYPSPPPERGLGGSSRQRERVPNGALASSGNNGGNGGMYRSAEDQKAVGAFRVAL